MKFRIYITTMSILLAGSLTVLTAQEIAPKIPEPPEPVVLSEDGGKVLYSFFRMSEKEEQETLKNLKPDVRTQLHLIKENNESRYYELLREYRYKGIKLPGMWRNGDKIEKEDNELLEYEISVEALAAKYKKATAGEKEKIKTDLKRNLSYLFDLKEKTREEEVFELEARLNELKKKMTIRKKNKDEIIGRRMEELLGEDKYLEWE